VKQSCSAVDEAAKVSARYGSVWELAKGATMTNPFLIEARPETKTLDKNIWLSPDYDDDDEADDDDADDADDEISQGPWRGQRWLSRSEFGSPEWWAKG